MKVHHLKDNSATSTLAGRQNASVVRTLFDLFYIDLALATPRKVKEGKRMTERYQGIKWTGVLRLIYMTYAPKSSSFSS